VYKIYEVRSFTRSRDNWGIQKIEAVPGYTPLPFYQNFNGLLPEITEIGVLGGVVNPQSWGRGGRLRRVSGMLPFE